MLVHGSRTISESGLLIKGFDPLSVVFPWTNSVFPCLRPHLLDRWGGEGRGASTPPDVLFSICPVLITAVGSPFTAVEFPLNLKLLSSHSFPILQSVTDHWETSMHYNLLWILLIHLCWSAWIFLSCTHPLLLLRLERFSRKSCLVQLNMFFTCHSFHG